MMATMRPYKARASPKMSTRIMLTYSEGCWPLARTPASPATPIDIPAASPLSPQQSPEARLANPLK